MNGLVVVGAAGAAGSLGRHLLDVGLRRWRPNGPSTGILVANVVGSLVLGLLTGVAADHVVDPDLRLAVAIGFCGGLTTFSTYVAQVAEQLEGGSGPRWGRRPALRWALVMVVAGLASAALGVALGRSL